MRRIRYWLCLLSALAVAAPAGREALAQNRDYFVYFGTYTGFKYVHHSKDYGVGESRSKGIYVSRMNAATGALSSPQLAAEIVNPSFLTISPDRRFVYAVSEDPLSVGPPLDHVSYVSAFSVNPRTGKLHLLNTLPTGGTSTCFISMDKTGKYVLMANFGSSSVSVLKVNPDGSLGEETSFIEDIGHSVNPSIQNVPHPHSILVSPDNHYVIVSDLGLDKIFIYHFDARTGQLSPPQAPFVTVRPGGGPRHFTFSPSGKFAYQLSEMSGILDAFAWDPSRGTLTKVQSAPTVPRGFRGDNHSAEIEIRADGRFLYESNRRTQPDGTRGPDTIGVFAINQQDGTLTEVGQTLSGGLIPRSFGIDPTGSYLLAANQLSNNIVEFRIDRAMGRLIKTGTEIDVDTPVCVQFLPLQP